MRICRGFCIASWSPDGKFMYIEVEQDSLANAGKTAVIPVPTGESLPRLPANGLLPAETASFPSPVPTQIVSSDEYLPVRQTARQRAVEVRLKELSGALALPVSAHGEVAQQLESLVVGKRGNGLVLRNRRDVSHAPVDRAHPIAILYDEQLLVGIDRTGVQEHRAFEPGSGHIL